MSSSSSTIDPLEVDERGMLEAFLPDRPSSGEDVPVVNPPTVRARRVRRHRVAPVRRAAPVARRNAMPARRAVPVAPRVRIRRQPMLPTRRSWNPVVLSSAARAGYEYRIWISRPASAPMFSTQSAERIVRAISSTIREQHISQGVLRSRPRVVYEDSTGSVIRMAVASEPVPQPPVVANNLESSPSDSSSSEDL